MSDKIFFVTGTDTGIGKTFISLLLLFAMKQRGISAGYMKPVETGVEIGEIGSKNYLDGLYIKRLAGLSDGMDSITPFTFELPLSPYAASKFEGNSICIKEIIFKFYELNKIHDYMIVEGAGGMLVPLKKNHFIIDIAKYIDAAVILVAKAGLGMINQTLLSIEYAKNNDIKLAGIIINNASNENDKSVSSNKEILCEFTDIPIIGSVPHIPEKKWMDEQNIIKYIKNTSLKYIDIDKILI
jgi:dethiobiotin synthetase